MTPCPVSKQGCETRGHCHEMCRMACGMTSIAANVFEANACMCVKSVCSSVCWRAFIKLPAGALGLCPSFCFSVFLFFLSSLVLACDFM